MEDTPTPLFPLETNLSEKEKAILNKTIDKVLKPVLVELSKGNKIKPNVGRFDEKNFIFYQPHNYRRVFDFHLKRELKNYYIKTYVKKGSYVGLYKGVNFKVINSASEIYIKDFEQCSIKIRKNSIEVCNKINIKRWYSVNLYAWREEISKIIIDKEKEVLSVLNKFIKVWGNCSTQYELKNFYTESKIKGSAITEKINPNLLWHKKEHKKVYKEKIVEVFDLDKAIKLIDNSILYQNAPEIAEPIKELNIHFSKLNKKLSKNYTLKSDLKDIVNILKQTNININTITEQSALNISQIQALTLGLDTLVKVVKNQYEIKEPQQKDNQNIDTKIPDYIN